MVEQTGTQQPGTWRQVLPHLRPARRQAVALGSALAAATALPLAAPQLTRRLIDGAVDQDSTDFLVALAAAYLVLAVGGQVAKVVTAWIAGKLAWDATNRLREDLLAHALRLDLDQHQSRTPGEMIERVDGDVTDIAEFIVAFLLEVVASFLLIIGVLGLVLIADVRIGAVLVVYLALVARAIFHLQGPAVAAMTAFRAANGRLFGYLEERFAALEDIRANGAGDHVTARFQGVSQERRDTDIRSRRLGGRVLGLTISAIGAGKAVVLALAVVFFGTGSVTLGTAVLLLQYVQMLDRPVTRLVHHLEDYQKAVAGLARVGAFLRLEPGLQPPAEGGRLLPTMGQLALELDRVSFWYPRTDEADQPALHDVSLQVAPGCSLGVVGHTGSGKTSLARLLVRFYDPSSGLVRLGGQDLRDIAPESLRRNVVYITQEVPLFSATVRDNLNLFNNGFDNGLDDPTAPGKPDDELINAVEAVGLGQWLHSLPAGLDTVIGPAEIGVSAGETQLLALARALLEDPRLVVLDEASSRLDPATELAVERAVDRLLAGRTAVIIGHRLASLDRVDDIAVFDHGRLVEHGPRESLGSDPASHYGRLLSLATTAGATP